MSEWGEVAGRICVYRCVGGVVSVYVEGEGGGEKGSRGIYTHLMEVRWVFKSRGG